ncbi:hypothetical protein [Deinococcus sp.]|uniref:hypothetical protein n=1 Tax=Deinococcus sp. TaxID=47478 RepID=UPI002869DE35|nr:hypothetical protein [Deinococcus sp.]
MNAALSRPRPFPTRSSRHRTVLVYAVGLGAVLLVSLLALTLPPQGPVRWAMLAVYGAGILCAVVGGWLLARPANLGLPQGYAQQMDERQREQVAQAMATSYRILGLLIIALFLGFMWGGDEAMIRLRSTQAGGGIAFTLLFLIPFLPNAVLAWTEPDLFPDMDQ